MSETAAQIKARHSEFANELSALVARYLDVCAPSIDAMGEICDHTVDEVCECGPPADVFMLEWSLVSNWVQMNDTHGSWSVAVHAPNMLRSHKVGLLKQHLDEL